MDAKALILTIGPWHEKPWWWEHIREGIGTCRLIYERIVPVKNKNESQVSIIFLPELIRKIYLLLRKHKPDYVFTFECGMASFLVAAMQTAGIMRTARHIILQFIMREKDERIISRLKYLLMRFILSSIHSAVCSSKNEVCYYKEVFKWKKGIAKFVPFHSNPTFLNMGDDVNEGYILTAGRTYRDYNTFLRAVQGLNKKVIMIVSPWNIDVKQINENIAVKFDVSMAKLTELMMRSAVVVIPLEEKKISTGQSVVLQAMAMGKAVVVTSTTGTIDYIHHGEDGILVPPGNFKKMREAIQHLLENDYERRRIGNNAKQRVRESYLPIHYYKSIKQLILSEIRSSYLTVGRKEESNDLEKRALC